MDDLQRHLQSMETREETNPLKIYQAQVAREHSGSGMRIHLSLLGEKANPTQCYCKLVKYGTEVFDRTKMPTWWKGCGVC